MVDPLDAVVPARPAGRWLGTWTAMPQLTEPDNLPPPPYLRAGLAFPDTTLRQTVLATIGGRRIRIRFSNAFGVAGLPITGAAVALPAGGRAGVSGIEPGSSAPLTFAGRPGTVVPPGAQVVSDPLEFGLPARANLTVTVRLATGLDGDAVTGHPGSRTTSYLMSGDQVADPDPAGATPVDHWYLLSGVEVWAPPDAAAAVLLGDSLTDGRGSTTNGNDRWPDKLVQRLHCRPGTADVAVLNQAAGGNRVLADGLGPSVLARLDRDALALGGVEWLVVFAGVNDIGTAAADDAAQRAVAAELICAYRQVVVRARARGIRVYAGTLAPFGGHDYDDPGGLREHSRSTVNDWIRDGGRFDAVLDVDRAVRDPANPRTLFAGYDEGDHLHLNPAGYRAIADAVPAELFERRPLPPDFDVE
nr:SGNH/GDSL hydrolase family protein [Micromonospora sp. DSM 115978]